METRTRMIEKRGSLLLILVLGSNWDKSTSIGPGWWPQPGLIVWSWLEPPTGIIDGFQPGLNALLSTVT